MDPVSIAIVSALAILLLAAVFERIGRSGQVKNALDTIIILQAQAATYKEDNTTLRARVEQLENALTALRDIVTGAAPLEKLAIQLTDFDRRASEALGRIEGFAHANQRNRDLEGTPSHVHND